MNIMTDSVFCEDELLEIARGLIRIDSENPPGREEAAVRYIQEVLEVNGIPVSLTWPAPGRPNLTAELAGSAPGPVLLYNGHTDVVPAGPNWTKDPLGAAVEKGRLYGRGTSDMKSGVAAMIYAAIVLKRMGRPFGGKLVLFFNVDEERANLGMRHMMNKPLKADYAVIGEPTGLDACVCHKGVGRYRIETFGTSGHTAVVECPDNAISKMVKVVEALERLGLTIRERRHHSLGSASLTVARFNGGSAANIVPGHAVVEIDRRILPGEQEDFVFAEIDRAVRETAAKGQFEYRLEQYLYLPPHDISVDHPLVRTALGIACRVTGERKRDKPFAACTEAPFFSDRLGIPTLIMGPGSLQEAHTADESADIREIADASRIYVRLACEMLPTERGKNDE